MARCRRLDRSMPCLSSPLSRVASALLAFLDSQKHTVKSCTPTLSQRTLSASPEDPCHWMAREPQHKGIQAPAFLHQKACQASSTAFSGLLTGISQQVRRPAKAMLTVLSKGSTPEVVCLVVRLRRVARADDRWRLQQRGHRIHHICSIQLRPRPILQPEAPAACSASGQLLQVGCSANSCRVNSCQSSGNPVQLCSMLHRIFLPSSSLKLLQRASFNDSTGRRVRVDPAAAGAIFDAAQDPRAAAYSTSLAFDFILPLKHLQCARMQEPAGW